MNNATAASTLAETVSADTKPATYEIDPAHSGAHFRVKHLMVANVRGTFSNVTGTVVYDPQNAGNSKIQATIDASTIDTRDAQRDAHLKSADFFNVEKFPSITFVSKKVENGTAGKLKVIGDLTIHGMTKEVTLDVEGPEADVKDPWGNVKAGASASTRVNRKDFGLTWNQALETGGVLVGDDVAITLDIELLRKNG